MKLGLVLAEKKKKKTKQPQKCHLSWPLRDENQLAKKVGKRIPERRNSRRAQRQKNWFLRGTTEGLGGGNMEYQLARGKGEAGGISGPLPGFRGSLAGSTVS